MKKLFYVVFLLIAITSCRKEQVITDSECTSDCFEITGIVTNASTNTPEAFRRIQVQTTTNTFPYINVNRGYVVTKADGSYLIRIAKSSFSDKDNINFVLTLEDKSGYLNDYHFNQYFMGNLKIDSAYTKNISVYQSANLNVIVNNASVTDSIHLLDLSYNFLGNYYSIYVDHKLAPGETTNYSFAVVLGKQTNLELLNGKIDSNYIDTKDSIVCNQINNNQIVFNLQ